MAECYDRSWRVGSKARGTRSQFRLNTGLLPFKCTYPAHLTDVMDAVPSTTSDFRRADFTSPVQGTRTRTVREYEQTIEELKKENFDLKLRLFLLEDNKNKNYLRNKGSNNEEQDNSVQVIVELKVETETLRNELACKCQQLQEALDEKEKYESELKELQSKFEEFQEQLTSLSPRPSEQELRLLKDENEILQKSNKDLTLILAEKDQNIELLNAQVDELSTKNKALKTKVEKSSLAIQGLVSKYYKDTEMIPKDLRPVVQSAVQAAKENRTEDLNAAVENIKASLSELMIANGGTSREARSNSVHGKDSMEELQKLAGISKSSEELAQVSQKSHQKSKHGHDGKDEQVSSESLQDSAKDKSESREDLEQMLDVVKENENLKLDNAEKAKIIDELNSACWEMEKKSIQLQSELLDAVSKVKDLDMKLKEEKSKHIGSLPMKHASVQTAVQWHLMQSKLSDKFAQNAGRSNNLEDLKEEILTLLLVIEQKDKEISDCEEKLSSLQQQLEIENKKEITFANLDKEFVKEKDELHQRLAHSCAVNNELMKHLRNLEIFMEDLLQHKNLDASSIENLSESSSFLSRLKIQREIEQSLELSTMLNDELSICESSKIFDPNDFTTSKDYSLSARYSYQPTDTSRFGLDLSNIPSNIQDTSRSSFICKKCMAHSQTSDAPSKDEKMDLQKVIDELSNKCHSQENHLENVINELNSKKNAIDALTKEKQELLNCINRLKETQKSLVESEASATERLARANSEYNKLQSLLKQFETRITHTDATCNQLKSELEKSKTQLKVLEQKCLEYVEELAMHSNAKTAFTEKLKSVEEEKAHLMDDVDALLMEKDELLSEIEVGKEYRRRLENENRSLSIKLNESSKEASLLRASSKNLEDAKNKLLKEKESCENSLMSSNSLCEELKNDLMKTQERLKKMEQKCAKYEEELNESLKSKQNITQSLSGIKSVMSSNFDALTSLCKQYLENNEAIETNKDILSNADKGDQIEMMLKEIISVNTKFQQIVKFLSEQLSSIHSAMEKSKVIENEDKSKINHLQGQLDDKEREIQSLKMLMVELQQKIEENKSINSEYQSQLEFAQKKLEDNEKLIKTLREEHKVKMQSLFEEFQQTLKNKEKFLEEFNHKAFASEKQLSSLQDEIHKYQNLINLKDDDITKLQERVFNLQTQINSILSKATSPAGQGSSKDNTRDFVSNSLKASASLSNENEANDEIMSTISNDASFNSIASEKEEEMGRKIDRYARKIKALQTKLLMTEKRIEILEKEKAELREELLAQVHGEKEKSKTSDEIETLVRELNELKSTLKTKTSFIKDLKSELFKTCNSLVDKQKEVDELQQKLSASSRNTEADLLSPVHIKLSPSYSDPIQKATEANIKELKKHKWELIQGILSHQKQLYERKNIHLGHFEKFKKHIEKLRSLQVSPSLFKSESEPLLNNSVATNSFYAEKCDRTLKNLQIELQLDVECLQNLKIFLKRFFMPLVLQNCICNNNNSKPDNDSNPSDKNTVNETKDSRRERLRLDLWKSSNVEVEHHPTTISTSDRLIATSSVVAHKLDLVEMALKEIKSALEHFKEMESPIGETPKKTAAKSLLLKILDELVNIDDNFTEVFHLKTVLKSLGLFDISIPPSPCKQESDRESLLSEETIALSRSGSLSPMSFDENFPYRLFTSSIKQKQESEHFRKSEGRPKQTLDISNRSQAAGGSQESLFLRSHFSSPDLGIESDPNHESSAPEQAEKEFKEVSGRMSKRQETMYSFTDSSSKIKDDSFGMGDTLHAIGYLEEYELLKKEVQESLVGIKTVLSRTSDGLHHLAKFTSPQKNLEYSTFKAIKDSCGNIEVCLRKAVKLVDNFWIAPCPSVKELNRLIQQNQELQDKLKLLQESKRRQEINFKEVMEKFKQAERLRENMEKKISKKLIKTKKVIRQAEIKILEKESQDLPSIPKYPCDDSAGQKS
ncbi:putative leucine-rich repeat-containing protein DDB_G0290503 isoform X4 [Argiope bruennichi]|uniref:putative leucine-rich repeat-containing protein DDB_G0290503 isoform X4 n=1 Tax=Argiope bruennichi TaxID=94029 RepID=UPI0024945F30|nr:putative leucine-rich repeat-containing protein DDB_G0290503 isoform X4 [Argiope bruennichi]